MKAVEPVPVELPAVARPAVNPATVYLARQTDAAARGVRRSLAHVAEIAFGAGVDPEAAPWWAIRREHATVIKAAVLESKLASSTVNHRLACLRGVLEESADLGLMSGEDKARAVKALRLLGLGDRDPAGRHVDHAELVAVFRALAARPGPGPRRDAAMIAVLAAVGPRRAELVGLDLASWLPQERRLVFRSKGRRDRAAPLNSAATDALADWVRVRGDWPGALFPAVNQRGVISRRRMSTTSVRTITLRWAKRAGVAAFSPHDLRRTLVGNLLDAGVDTIAAQRFIGHQSPVTTARYDRRGERVLREAAARLVVPYVPPEVSE